MAGAQANLVASGAAGSESDNAARRASTTSAGGLGSSPMVIYERTVRFHEVDAAGLLYFPHFLSFAHEAMEALFEGLEGGGYVGLICRRRIGLPAVQVQTEFSAPVRYGDNLRIEVCLEHLGNRSMTLRYRFLRASDGVTAAVVRHTVVSTDLTCMKSCDKPPDVRRLVAEHQEPA
jgi:YbgC/YbaW family acyl-CoA thioester hydrolase